MHDDATRKPVSAPAQFMDSRSKLATGLPALDQSKPVMPASKAIDPDKLYSTKQTADFLHMSDSWLAKGRLKGDGPPYVKLGRAVRYQGRDIIEHLKSKKRHSTSE